MPDLERIVDEFKLQLADSPEEKARIEGFIAGKSYARKQLVYMVLFLVSFFGFSYALVKIF